MHLRARVSYSQFPGPSSVELCSLLVRNVSYEIPSLKKQIAKCQQLQQEYSRKEEEGQAGAAEMREQFYHSCKQYGITVSSTSLQPDSLGTGSLRAQLHCSWQASFSVGLCPAWVSLTFLQSLNVLFDSIVSISHHV